MVGATGLQRNQLIAYPIELAWFSPRTCLAVRFGEPLADFTHSCAVIAFNIRIR